MKLIVDLFVGLQYNSIIEIKHTNKQKPTKGNKMNYIKIETTNLVNFTAILMDGIVSYDMICNNSHVSDVTLGGININDYLPKEHHCADGTVHGRGPLETDLLELLAASDGETVSIYNHDGEVFNYTIADGLVNFTSYERDGDW